MKKLKEFWESLPETVTVTRLDGILIVTICALAGVIVGMLCSPKKTITIGSGNTANYFGDEDDKSKETNIREDDEDITSFKCL